MKKTTDRASMARMTPLAAFTIAMHADWQRALQPLCALRTGWRDAGLSGAYQAVLWAQRDSFPQSVFLLLIAQGLVLALLQVAVALDGVLAWGGLPRWAG